MRFSGEIALVTGAGSGVGLAAAQLFARDGARVVATVERDEQLAALDDVGCFMKLKLDVTSPEDWAVAIERVEAAGGAVDILFNNAGVTERGNIEDTDLALWDRVLRVDLTSVYLGCRAVVPGMLAKGRGAIVNNASINGLLGNTGLVAYTAAKTGVVGLTRALAIDYAARGIRVNCICPAAINTPMTEDYLASVPNRGAVEAAIVSKHPIGRMAEPEEVASVAVFLASQEASYLTGLAIPVDGARSIR